jgi:hypothetical protein
MTSYPYGYSLHNYKPTQVDEYNYDYSPIPAAQTPTASNPYMMRSYDYSYDLPDFSNYFTTLVQLENYFEDEMFRQPNETVDRIMRLINPEFGAVFNELQRYGMRRNIAANLFKLVVSYTVRNMAKYTGNINQKTSNIFEDLRKQLPWILLTFRGFGIPTNRINDIIKSIIRFTLTNIDKKPTPPPQREWSDWEDLGGILTSAPAASSWGRNRLDVFGRGTNNALWHIYWNGSRWSVWEDLGGSLTSSPAAVSWGPNRIDVFGRGTNNALWHKWWDGSRWSQWEDLGGVLTSAPSVSSWALNRLDVFVKGTDNALWHKWWDGSKWNDWESLGGVLTSAPAAVSWGPNRIDVFGRGTNNALWHKWWDGSRWSEWEDLGGNLTSGPAASSRASNRIDVFARGQNNNLIFKFWNGVNWSNWQNLNGNITSEPASVSWGPDRIDVFARGQNQHLWHVYKD